jgi:hypothetical protein
MSKLAVDVRRRQRDEHEAQLASRLSWRRTASGWVLLIDKRRRYGNLIPDAIYPDMWRSVLSGGRVSDMANVTWAKHAVFEAALRELGWEVRKKAA